MTRLAILMCLFATGCCCFDDEVRGPGDRPPPLPADNRAGTRFDREMESLLGPDRKFDPDIRPPFAISPDPRLPQAPRAEDPSWKNR
jgi:hypothetical protein